MPTEPAPLPSPGLLEESIDRELPRIGATSDRRFRGNFAAIVLILLNIPVALLDRLSSVVSTAHALTVFLAGIVFALRGQQEFVAYTAAYIAGAEVLWRMTGAATPY